MNERITFGTDGWRDIIADGFTFHNVRLVSRAIANHILHEGRGEQGVVVAHDNRFMASDFARQVAGVLAAAGIPVMLSRTTTPTPAAAFAVQKHGAAGAVMLTASHNPPRYMGIKFIPHYAGPAMPAETDDLVARIRDVAEQGEVPFRHVEDAGNLVEMMDIKDAYLEHMAAVVDRNILASSSLKIVVDPMHGAGAGYMEEFLKDVCEVTAIRNYADPLFGGALPDPTRQHLDLLVETVARKGSHLGVALDGDADRLGVVDGAGRYYSPNQILTMFLHYLTGDKGYKKGRVARTVATTHMLDRIAAREGLEVLETPVGFKYICDMMVKKDILIGGEETGGIGFKGYIPERDGFLSALLIMELMASRKRALSEILSDLDRKYGKFVYEREDILFDASKRKKLLSGLGKEPLKKVLGKEVVKVNDSDGYKFMLRDGTWLLLRLSGTEPKLRIYSETPSRKRSLEYIAFGKRYAFGLMK